MKYLLVIDHIATGGAERILIDYYHHLIKSGHNVSIFVLTGRYGESIWTEGIKIIYGSSKDVNNLLLKTKQQIHLYRQLSKVVKAENPDVIFSFLEKSNILSLSVPSKAKKIVTVHNVLSIQYQKIKSKVIRKLVYLLIRKAYNHCNYVVAVSQQVKNDLIHTLKVKKENITVINNFVDPDTIQEKAKEEPDNFCFQENTNYIINIGRFSDQKAQWKLIKAYSISKSIQNEWELILMGHGEYKDKLIKLAIDLGVQEKVHILPFSPNPYKYLKRANLVVLSSLFEGFPIVLAEASSLRIPFIGSEKAIPEEMFNNQNFWATCIFKIRKLGADFSTNIQKDEEDLSNLIIRFTKDDQLRKRILENTQNWEKHNNKNYQFKLYDQMVTQTSNEP